MENFEQILESLSYIKFFKTEIRGIGKALSRSKVNSTTVKIYPDFSFSTRLDFPDFPGISHDFSYKWDIKNCLKVKKIGDFLIFGIDLSRVGLKLDDNFLSDSLFNYLSERYVYESLGDLSRNITFYNFCKNSLGLDDSSLVNHKNLDAFFSSSVFKQGIVPEYMDLVESSFEKNKPLVGNVKAVGDDIIPLVYYSISKRTCYHLGYTGMYYGSDNIKLDIRTLSSRAFHSIRVDYIDSAVFSGIRVPRFPIANDGITV